MVVSENSVGILCPFKLFWIFPYVGNNPSCGTASSI